MGFSYKYCERSYQLPWTGILATYYRVGISTDPVVGDHP
jgi:hypothetical protein